MDWFKALDAGTGVITTGENVGPTLNAPHSSGYIVGCKYVAAGITTVNLRLEFGIDGAWIPLREDSGNLVEILGMALSADYEGAAHIRDGALPLPIPGGTPLRVVGTVTGVPTGTSELTVWLAPAPTA